MSSKPHSLDCLKPLMMAKGVVLSPAEFHKRVNLVFHSHEADIYDAVHRHMAESLPRQAHLLASDCLAACQFPDRKLRWLDIGCGTGMSADLLLRSPLGVRCGSIDLLDTSSRMLSKAEQRSAQWSLPTKLIEGDVTSVVGPYDLILSCSVLHHIPDLSKFCEQIQERLVVGGVFIHMHDPNHDHFLNPELIRRSGVAERLIEEVSKSRWKTLVRRVNHYSERLRGNMTYLEATNRDLMAQGVIRMPLTDEELWSVTDIHEMGLPFSTSNGVSVSALRRDLSQCRLVATRAWGFFGHLVSELPKSLKPEDAKLELAHSMNGRFIGAVWQRRN